MVDSILLNLLLKNHQGNTVKKQTRLQNTWATTNAKQQ